jgi:hypothetical protein
MGMEFWLIPVVAMAVAGVATFYLIVRREGGTGVRAEGQTMVDKPVTEQKTQASWNYYR